MMGIPTLYWVLVIFILLTGQLFAEPEEDDE